MRLPPSPSNRLYDCISTFCPPVFFYSFILSYFFFACNFFIFYFLSFADLNLLVILRECNDQRISSRSEDPSPSHKTILNRFFGRVAQDDMKTLQLLTLHSSRFTFSLPPHPNPQPFGIQSHKARSSPVRTSIPQGERENILRNKPFNPSPFQLFNSLYPSLPPHFVFLCHPEFISGSPRHPEAHEQRVKGVSHTRLLRPFTASAKSRRIFWKRKKILRSFHSLRMT